MTHSSNHSASPRWAALGLLVGLLPAASIANELGDAYYRDLLAAEQLLTDGEHEAAAARFDDLHRRYPLDGSLLQRSGIAWENANQLQRAISRLDQYYHSGGQFPERVAFRIARLCARTGAKQSALEWLERSINDGYGLRPRILDHPDFASISTEMQFKVLAGAAPQGLNRVAGWQHDLVFMVSEARRLHAGPDRPAWSSRFSDAVAQLSESARNLNDLEVSLALQEICASLEDGHTGVWLGYGRSSMDALPIRLYAFSDGIFVIEGTEDAEQLVGSELMMIGSRPAADALADLAKFVSRDNEMGLRWIGPKRLVFPPILRRLGCAYEDDRATLTFKSPDGSLQTTELEAGAPLRSRKLFAPTNADRPAPMYLTQTGERHWFQIHPPLNAIYLQLNQILDEDGETLEQFSERLRLALREPATENLIIDLRHNNGGNNFLNWPLLRVITHHRVESASNRVFVITGRETFSAAQNFLTHLERLVDPIVVGEPSSSRPNFTGETTIVDLPWSGLRLGFSNRNWQDSFPGDERPWIAPHVPTPLGSADYFANVDPAMDAIAAILRDK